MAIVLHKIQWHCNIDNLREIDDDTIDDDVSSRDSHVVVMWCACELLQDETEWQSFLRQCLEFVGKVAELFPEEAFQMIVRWVYNVPVY